MSNHEVNSSYLIKDGSVVADALDRCPAGLLEIPQRIAALFEASFPSSPYASRHADLPPTLLASMFKSRYIRRHTIGSIASISIA